MRGMDEWVGGVYEGKWERVKGGEGGRREGGEGDGGGRGGRRRLWGGSVGKEDCRGEDLTEAGSVERSAGEQMMAGVLEGTWGNGYLLLRFSLRS